MFPLDLPGPDFLAFYGLFAAIVIAALHIARRHREQLPLPQIDPRIPICSPACAAVPARSPASPRSG